MRRQEPAERSRHICGTSLESSMLYALTERKSMPMVAINAPRGIQEALLVESYHTVTCFSHRWYWIYREDAYTKRLIGSPRRKRQKP